MIRMKLWEIVLVDTLNARMELNFVSKWLEFPGISPFYNMKF